MHYLSYLAGKLAAESQNQSAFPNQSLSRNRGDSHTVAESLRQVLEEEVAAGRLRYNALSYELEVVNATDESIPYFPGWAENQS